MRGGGGRVEERKREGVCEGGEGGRERVCVRGEGGREEERGCV